MTPTIYVLGHLDIFQQALIGLQMIFHPTTGSTDWAASTGLFGAGPIVILGLLASLLHLSTKGIWTQQLHVHHVPLMLVLYAAFFIPTTTVDVHDIMSGTDAVVDNIPIGVAYPAAIISNLGYDAATQIGQAFQSVTATAPPTAIVDGVASPLKQMLAMRRLYGITASQQPALTQDIADYVAQCVYTNAPSSAGFAWPAIYNAQSLASYLFDPVTSGVTPTGTVQMYPIPATLVPTGGSPCTSGLTGTYCTETCASAQADLKAAMATWLTMSSGGCATSAKMATASPNMAQVTDCSTNLNNSMGPLVSSSVTASSILTGANNFGVSYVENMYLGCLASQGWQMGLNANAAAENSSLTLPSYCVIDGNSQSSFNVSSAASGNLFLNNMASMMTVLQFLFFALSPLVAAAMVFAGAQGLGLLMKFILFGMWTQSWMAVAAILNDYAQYNVADTMAQIMAPTAPAGTTTVAASNLTSMANLSLLIDHVQKTLASADLMLAMTPIITMFVFTGSYMALANVAGRMSGDVKDASGAEAPRPSEQRDIFGVHSTGNPNAGGYQNYDAAIAASQGWDVGHNLALARQAAWNNTTTATNSAIQAFNHMIEEGNAYSRTNSAGQKVSMTEAVYGKWSQSAAYSNMFSGSAGQDLTHAQQLQFAAGVSTVGGEALAQINATNPNATDAQKAEYMMQSIRKWVTGTFAGLGSGVLSSLNAKVMPQIQAALNTDKGRQEIINSGQKIADDYGNESKNNYSSDHGLSSDAKVTDAVKNAQTNQAQLQIAMAKAAQISRAASDASTFGGSLKGNSVLLANALLANSSNPNASAKNILLAAYGNDAQAAEHAEQVQRNRGAASPLMAITDAIAARLADNDPGSAQDRWIAGDMATRAIHGVGLGDLPSGFNATTATAQQRMKEQTALGQHAMGGTKGQVQPLTRAAASRANEASGLVAGAPALSPGLSMPADLRQIIGKSPESYLAAQPALLQKGQRDETALAGALDMGAINKNAQQTQMDLNSFINDPVEWAAAHPAEAAGIILGYGGVMGMLKNGAAGVLGAQLWKRLRGGGKGGPSSPNDRVDPTLDPTQPPGSGGAPNASSDLGAKPDGALPGSKPAGALPGNSSNPTSPGGNPGAPQTAEIVDANGNVVGTANVRDIYAAAQKAVGPSGGNVDAVATENLARVVAEAGGTAIRFGAETIGMFLGAAGDAAFALTPTPVASGTVPAVDQQNNAAANATDQLRLHNPEFRQQWNQFTNLLRNRGANSPEAAALSNSLRQQVNAAVANGNDQPITDPRQKATAALLNDSQFLQAYDYVEANGKGPNANSPGVQKAREWVNQVIDRQMAFDADTSD